VGLALENARLYAREHSVAELLQESLLTLPGEVTAFEFASAYRSATHGARVGGDSYDLFQLADGRVCMMVGDVAGHGIGAAVLTSQLKYALRAQATAGATPSEAVLIANRMLYASTEPEIFVSVFFGIFDPKGNTLQYCNAGHVTIYLVEADGTLGRLAANGPVIGAAPTVPSVTNECAIPDGALLFLYTDGIVEVGPRTSMFGETRLGVLLARTWSGDPSQVVDEVLRAVSVFAQGDLRDDIAMLALGRRQGHAQP
jgi:serine phosphatase RsbU (regulator of sigma subunit)